MLSAEMHDPNFGLYVFAWFVIIAAVLVALVAIACKK